MDFCAYIWQYPRNTNPSHAIWRIFTQQIATRFQNDPCHRAKDDLRGCAVWSKHAPMKIGYPMVRNA
jgi:hypothetical protein